jgi:hypothetical protein
VHQDLRRRRRAGRHRLVDDLVEVVRSQHRRLLRTVANRAGGPLYPALSPHNAERAGRHSGRPDLSATSTIRPAGRQVGKRLLGWLS